jgi:hypothetical protein
MNIPRYVNKLKTGNSTNMQERHITILLDGVSYANLWIKETTDSVHKHIIPC